VQPLAVDDSHRLIVGLSSGESTWIEQKPSNIVLGQKRPKGRQAMRYVSFLLVLIALILGACQPIVAQPESVASEQEAAAQQKVEEEQFVEAAMANEDAFQSGDDHRVLRRGRRLYAAWLSRIHGQGSD
jgi:hypothetical protein